MENFLQTTEFSGVVGESARLRMDYGVSGSWDGQARTGQRRWLVPTNAIRPVYGGLISLRRM